MNTSELISHSNKAYRENLWHGFGLLYSLSNLPEFSWHEALGRRTVANMVGHLIAWRNFAIARIDDRHDFPIELHTENDWPDCSKISRETLLQQLEDSQVALVATLERLEDHKLTEHFPAGYAYSKGELALGVMQHDIYHTGQINLLVALIDEKSTS